MSRGAPASAYASSAIDAEIELVQAHANICELLVSRLDVRLSTGSIDPCILEAGLAFGPIVEGLIEDLRGPGFIRADETPRPHPGQKLRCSGWLYARPPPPIGSPAGTSRRPGPHRRGRPGRPRKRRYGHSTYRRRQRFAARLLRKGIALIEGYACDASRIGEWLMKEMIRKVAENGALDAEAHAVTAFIHEPDLQATNYDTQTAVRHAVIGRRISHGSRAPKDNCERALRQTGRWGQS